MIELTEIYAIYEIIYVGKFGTDQRRLNPQRLLEKRHPDYIGVLALMVDRSVP
jgi:hypothetical protein